MCSRILNEKNVQCLINAPKNLRDRVLLRLLYASGTRVSELAQLHWKALLERHKTKSRDAAGQITILGKGNKTRTVLLSTSTWKYLQELQVEEMAKRYGEREHPVFRSKKGGHCPANKYGESYAGLRRRQD